MNHSDLLANVAYNPFTGVFTRKTAAGNQTVGAVIGNLNAKGYLKAKVLGQYVRLNRLAWFYIHGIWPTHEVDHINGCKSDNRLNNLRDCNGSLNCLNQSGPRINNRLGIQGVHLIKKTGRYRAKCCINGKTHHIGVFATATEAEEAYNNFKTPYKP